MTEDVASDQLGPPPLELRGITKTFGAVAALSDIDLVVQPGQVTALVGDNGAGKSTLIKVISGVHRPDSGQIFVSGEPVTFQRPTDSRRSGITTVHQDLALCDNLDVVANVHLGAEVTRRRLLDALAMEERTRELIKVLGVKIPDVRTQVASLSGGQRQCVAIARALLGAPRIVLLDEPTAALGVEQTALVLEMIGRLREQRIGVVVISHNLSDVFQVADRIVVLRLGRLNGVYDPKVHSRDDVVGAITGASLAGAMR
jgi:D-xylose transport system ATP-binding protein